jgi:superfamily II DNA/RNA helicase
VLTATDIAARGIHVDDVELVDHEDPPAEHKSYLHRSGRTARAGASGSVVTLVTPEQKRDVAALVRLAKISPITLAVRAGSEELRRLVGPPAPRVDAPAPAAGDSRPQRQRSTGQQGSRAGQQGSRAGQPGSRAGQQGSRAGQGQAPSGPRRRRRSRGRGRPVSS